LKDVLSHELAAVPPSLFHDDGNMRKTVKADLAKKIEENCAEVHDLSQIDNHNDTAYIIDGMAILQSLKETLFNTYDDLAKQVLLRIKFILSSQLGVAVVVLVFDRYDKHNSIKQFERTRTGGSSGSPQTHAITGKRTVPNYRSFMKKYANKAALAHFTCSYLESHLPEILSADKYVILSGGYNNVELVKIITITETSEAEDLNSSQEEADTRLILHAVDLGTQFSRIII